MTELPISAEHYSDIIDAGGLVAAVQGSLVRNDSPLKVTGFVKSRFPVYARVELGDRSSQIYVAVHERLFLFDIWRDGVIYGNGQTTDIDELAITIDRWVRRCCSVPDIALSSCIHLTDTAKVFDDGGEVEHRWCSYLADEHRYLVELAPVIQLASRQPLLRGLFPYTSHNTLCFSRCTGYPYSYDCPHVTPIGVGQFQVGANGIANLGSGDASIAVQLLIANLPENCGPAIRGTADKLKLN